MLAGIEEALHAWKSFEVSGANTAIDTMLAGLIDYAGLFAPANLDMRRAVQNYLAYQAGKHASALGRFILHSPNEFCSVGGSDLARIRLSLLVISTEDMRRPEALLDRGMRVESIETKISVLRSFDEMRKDVPAQLELYVEVPMDQLTEETISAMASAGIRLKLRMGGTVPEAFPSVESVARALDMLERHRLPFKATAGLHHPLRSTHRLTYAPESPIGIMHGFVNLFCAAALMHSGGSATEAVQLLEERNPRAWNVSSRSLSWRTRSWTADQLSEARKRFVSFGSCSFEEPIGDLEAMGWL